ncbi:MFS family permease [Arcanobacterium wilhelmae]|uniref:MFS family permease n=1 Tax=Arcanobacterium wilhelmae TaxID=1803177 RepID=A0ABT9N9D9_9ACTO|nr:MFS transporter [Arcanobacterium wilhelmae]MDP9800315.1 MFS family permease [Arcanobacterium wilhelmae]WFN89751.1 MFS transporter [Arcanobacterium wilhelmae]
MDNEQQPYQVGDNPRKFSVPGTDRIFDRNELLTVLMVPLAMVLMQISSVNIMLDTMSHSIGMGPTGQQWVLAGYVLATGISLIPAGRLGDVFGRSSLFVLGLGVFSVASLALTFAPNSTYLNIMRAFQGLGGGLFAPQTTGLIQQYFTGRARAKAFAMFGLVVAFSVAAGPLLSGALIAWFGPENGWRGSFLINFPLGVLGIILAFRWLPFTKERRHVGAHAHELEAEYEAERAAEGRPVNKTKIDLDPVGAILITFTVLAIMLPFTLRASWSWGFLPLAVIALVAWIFWERSYKARGHFPMVDMELFRIPTYSYSMAITGIQFMGATSIFVVLAIYMQEGLHAPAIHVALVGLPSAALGAVGAYLAGQYSFQHGRGIMVLGLIINLLALLGSTAVVIGIEHTGMSYWWLAPVLALQGIGQGTLNTANQTQAMLDVPPSHGGTAGGVLQAAQRTTTAIGTAIITAVFFATQTTSHNWHVATMSAYLVIIGIITVALVIALLFWRKGYAQRHPKQGR